MLGIKDIAAKIININNKLFLIPGFFLKNLDFIFLINRAHFIIEL